MNAIGIGKIKHAVKQEVQHEVKQDDTSLLGNAPRSTPRSGQKEGQLSVDILNNEKCMTIICPMAGVEKSDIQLALQDDVLTIRGVRKKIPALPEGETIVRELFWGDFSRSIVLPDHIDRGGIEAKIHENMLIVSIPKTEDFKTRIIHIKE